MGHWKPKVEGLDTVRGFLTIPKWEASNGKVCRRGRKTAVKLPLLEEAFQQ